MICSNGIHTRVCCELVWGLMSGNAGSILTLLDIVSPWLDVGSEAKEFLATYVYEAN